MDGSLAPGILGSTALAESLRESDSSPFVRGCRDRVVMRAYARGNALMMREATAHITL